jgi:hypothetical protein
MGLIAFSCLVLIPLISAPQVHEEYFLYPGTSEILADSIGMDAMPVDSIADLAGKQAGVINRGGIHFRGGRSGEILYMVDGVLRMDPFTGSFHDDVPLSAIAETAITVGGLGTPLGGAQSGVISTVTREGGPRYSGEVSLTGNDWQALGMAPDRTWSHPGPFREAMLSAEAAVGGPEPLTGYLLPALGVEIPGEAVMFVSGEWLRTGGGEAGGYGYWFNDWIESWSGTLKLTYVPSGGTKINLTGSLLNRTSSWLEDNWIWNRITEPLIDMDPLSPSYGDTLVPGNPPSQSLPVVDRQNYSLGFDLHQDLGENAVLGLRLSHYCTDYTHRIRNPAGSFTAWLGEGWSIDDWSVFVPERIQDYDGFYRQGPHRNVWREAESSVFTFGFDLTGRIGAVQTLQGGFEGKYWDASWFDVDAVSSDSLGIASFHAMPRATALYITDRIELDDMTGSFGLRYDTFDPNAVLLDSTVSVKHLLSPRIGLSYQLTESDILSMNYGRYYQVPSFLHLYGGNDLSLPRSFGPQGNPDLDPMETISYELGIRHYFSNFASIGVTGYYRDFSGLIDTRRIWDTLGVYHDVFINTDFGHARGLVVSVSKHQRNFWSFDFNYTFAEARGTSSSDVQNSSYESSGWFIPTSESWLDWDQHHTINAGLDFRIPRGEGPMVVGIPVLEGFGLNLQWKFGSGFPFTTSQNSLLQPVVNNERYPSEMNTDLKVNKTFWTGPLAIDLFCEVRNLFSRHNIVDIKDVSWYMSYAGPDPCQDPMGQLGDPSAYCPHRQIRFGINLAW